MSIHFVRQTILGATAAFGLAALSSVALACDCTGDGRGYYPYHDAGYGNYSCYGGGADCHYEGSYYRERAYRYRDDPYRYYRHRYYDGYRYRECDRDCRY
jgi:hypothetical protein